MYLNMRMDKQIIVNSYTSKVLSNKMKQTPNTCNNMDESQ